MTTERKKLAAEEFAELYEEEKRLEEQLEEIKAKRQNLEGRVVTQFAELGARKMKTGRYTVYLVPELRVSLVGDGPGRSKHGALAALRSAGRGDLIEERAMDSELVKMVKKLDDDEKPIPEELNEWMKVHRGFRVQARRTSK